MKIYEKTKFLINFFVLYLQSASISFPFKTAEIVTVVLYNGKTADSAENASDKHLSENLSEGLSVNQQKILKMIIDKSYTNASDAAKMIHISRNTILFFVVTDSHTTNRSLIKDCSSLYLSQMVICLSP